ncbi:alpha-ketoglutarate-dependent dioxygenase AlkB family protein [Portibacter marinus]|uniref:alpha-ketoglutarate-dependent dioxygenase AlkB family protein n=1 Tax=Portibacter marinus TaxID=2898660 RepID=UPI001F347280|nr:alpha-ketoglutarate-dependent dioxygenase AlkB [Portibacter marinus]
MLTEKKILIEDGEIQYFPAFLNKDDASKLLNHFIQEVPWRKDRITIFGKTYDVPRLQAWYGDEGAIYSYSNIDLNPIPWTKELLTIKNRIEKYSHQGFNSVLLNLYRDGSDSNGWHSDDEKELGPEPEIASISIGQERVFQLKHKSKPLKERIILENGSLLIMRGSLQKFWKHQIPKSKKTMKPRINLTFRKIIT